MDTYNLFDKLLNTLQRKQPGLDSGELDEITENIMSRIEKRGKWKRKNVMVINIVKACSSVAAIFLITIFVVEVNNTRNLSGTPAGNPYFNTVINRKTNTAHINSLETVIKYYTEKRNDKHDLSSLAIKYISGKK